MGTGKRAGLLLAAIGVVALIAWRWQAASADAVRALDRGKAKHEKGDLDGALADYEEALRLRPDFGEALNNRALIRKKRGDLTGALADLDAAARASPSSPEIYNSRGGVKRARGDLDGAVADFDAALRLRADYVHAWCNRGYTRSLRGEADAALADLTHALKLEPTLFEGWFYRGLANGLAGRRDAALADLAKAGELRPGEAKTTLFFVGLGGDLRRLEPLLAGGHWPAPIARLFLGKLGSEQLFAETLEAPSRRESLERACEAYAFQGLFAEHEGRVSVALESYRACLATGIAGFERDWAGARLASLEARR
jgi:tetratricopeptide (TPR) repeat protein